MIFWISSIRVAHLKSPYPAKRKCLLQLLGSIALLVSFSPQEAAVESISAVSFS